MRPLLIAAALALGCATDRAGSAPEPKVCERLAAGFSRCRDERARVTCWRDPFEGGMSCLRDETPRIIVLKPDTCHEPKMGDHQL